MAYVALSRVRSLSGLHLIEFHSKSLMVSVSCLREVNRLREKCRPLSLICLSQMFRSLSLCAIPAPSKVATKRGLVVAICVVTNPDRKKQHTATKTLSRIRKQTFDKSDSVIITGTGQVRYKLNPGDEQWQRNACSTLGLVYMEHNRVTPGGPDIDLKLPNGFKRIEGDGNCLFWTFSFIITGSENQHMTVHHAILDHMVRIAHLLLFHLVAHTPVFRATMLIAK